MSDDALARIAAKQAERETAARMANAERLQEEERNQARLVRMQTHFHGPLSMAADALKAEAGKSGARIAIHAQFTMDRQDPTWIVSLSGGPEARAEVLFSLKDNDQVFAWGPRDLRSPSGVATFANATHTWITDQLRDAVGFLADEI